MAELHYLVYRRMSFRVERVEVAVGVLSIPILAVALLVGPFAEPVGWKLGLAPAWRMSAAQRDAHSAGRQGSVIAVSVLRLESDIHLEKRM